MKKEAYATVRYRAYSMEFVAHVDEPLLEMHIVTDQGQPLSIVCDKHSILPIQKYIKHMVQACPEISEWNACGDIDGFQDNAAGS